MDYISIEVKLRKNGKWLDHWSELDVKDLIKVKKLVQELEHDIGLTIIEKNHERLMKETT